MPNKSGRKKTKPAIRRRQRWGRWFAGVLLLAVLLPILQVLYVRFFDPPITPLMLIRRIEGRFSKDYTGQIAYQWIDLEKVPKYFLKCVWVTEDARFFQHNGIDWKEIEAARVRARKTGGPIRGASTITMQCARSLFLWQGRSYVRKGLEAGYTILMEWLLSKRRILELYVNVIEMGDGVYGIEAAAEHYYGRDAGKLTKSQCAMLAVILPAPRKWNPNDPSTRLRGRHRRALRDNWKNRFPKNLR